MASEPGRSRGRRAKSKGPKKPPQRGLGVAQLERLRIQEQWKKMTEQGGVGGGVVPTLHDHHLQCHTPVFASGSNVPVRYAASSSSHVHPHQGPFRLGSFAGSGPPLLVGNPLETSKELSSMPNLHSTPDYFDVSIKKTSFNEDSSKGSNAKRDRPMEIWSNCFGFLNKLARRDAAAAHSTPNLDEGAEVAAVHKRGNSVTVQYEFLPEKDGRGTTSKELEFPLIGSVAVGVEASSTTAAAYGDSASNSIDLSLKL